MEPDRKELQRWTSLAARAWVCCTALEQYLGGGALESCSCATLSMADGLQDAVLEVPKEVLALRKKREKRGLTSALKLHSTQKVSAREFTDKCRVLFEWIQHDITNGMCVHINMVTELRWLYSHVLKLVNHWNFAHRGVNEGFPTYFLLLLGKVLAENDGILGIVAKERNLLEVHLGWVAPTPTPVIHEGNTISGGGGGGDGGGSVADGAAGGGGGYSTPPLLVIPPPENEEKLSGGGGGFMVRLRSPRKKAPPAHGRESAPAAARESVPSKLGTMMRTAFSRSVSVESLPPSPPPKKGGKGHAWGTRSPEMARSRSPEFSPTPSPPLSPKYRIPSADLTGLRECIDTNPELLAKFLQHAESRHASENVEFYVDVHAAMRLSREEDIRNSLTAIVGKYLESNSENEVNISARAKKRIIDPISENPGAVPDFATFETALKEVEAQLIAGLWQPFVNALIDGHSSTKPGTTPASSGEKPAITQKPQASEGSLVADQHGEKSAITQKPPANEGSLVADQQGPGSLEKLRKSPLSRSSGAIPGIREELASFVTEKGLESYVALYTSMQDYVRLKGAHGRFDVGKELMDRFVRTGSSGIRVPLSDDIVDPLCGAPVDTPAFDDALANAQVWLKGFLEVQLFQPFVALLTRPNGLLDLHPGYEVPSFAECLTMTRRRPRTPPTQPHAAVVSVAIPSDFEEEGKLEQNVKQEVQPQEQELQHQEEGNEEQPHAGNQQEVNQHTPPHPQELKEQTPDLQVHGDDQIDE